MLISVVLSFRNEEEVLPELVKRLQKTFKALALPYELIFVNDASTDRSLEILKELAKEEPAIKVINMSRRFGNAPCVLMGFHYAKGDLLLYMDADLQDPPELIPQMLEKIKEGADVVYTTRLSRIEESRVKMWLTKWTYRFLRFSGNMELPIDSGDFKMVTRRVADEIRKLKEKNPFMRGLITWVGFKQVPLYYHRETRYAGKTHFPFFDRVHVQAFLSALTSFSTLPLHLILIAGLFISFLSFVYLSAILVLFFLGMNIPGWTTIVAVMLILGGTQLLTIGFLGLYVGRIYDEVKGRPRCVVESTFGFENSSPVTNFYDRR